MKGTMELVSKRSGKDDELVMKAVSIIQSGKDDFHSNRVLMSTMTQIIKLMADVGTTKSLQQAHVLLTATEVCLSEKHLLNLKNSDYHIKAAADVSKLKSILGDELISSRTGIARKLLSAAKSIFKN
jgi:hypothetical protein